MRAGGYVSVAVAGLTGTAISAGLVQSAGASVDLFVTTIVLISVITPLTVAWSDSRLSAILTAGAFCCGSMAGGFWLTHLGNIRWTNAGSAGLVGLMLGLALSGTARLLSDIAGDARIGPGVVAVIGFGWVTWPVWLSDRLAGDSLIRSVAIQPLFAVNSAVPDLGNWVDQPLAYQLTSFGQDLLYKMPASVWPAVMFHGSIAVVTWAAVFWLARRPRGATRREASTPTSPRPA